MSSASTKSWWRHAILRPLAWDHSWALAQRRRGTLVPATLTVSFACYTLANGALGHQAGPRAVAGCPHREHCFPPRRGWIAYRIATAGNFSGSPWCSWGATEIFGSAAAAKRSPGHAIEFAGYRAVHIEGGTSPVLPVIILLLAIYLFCWLRLSRLRMEEERHAAPPTGKDAEAFSGCAIPPKAVRDLDLGQFTFRRRRRARLAALFQPVQSLCQPGGHLLRRHSGLPLHHRDLHACRGVHSFSAHLGLLRKLLQDLERHPLRYAFSRLPKDFSWTTIWAGDPRPQLIMPARSLDVLRSCPGRVLQPSSSMWSSGSSAQEPGPPVWRGTTRCQETQSSHERSLWPALAPSAGRLAGGCLGYARSAGKA